jgi:hypothetical protein
MTVTNILKVLSPYFKIPAFMTSRIDAQPYFVFSIDFNDDVFRARSIGSVHLYIQENREVHQGNSCHWGHDGMYGENGYVFFQIPQEKKQFINEVKHSSIWGPESEFFLKHEVVRHLMPCYKICVAHKKGKDGIYFSRVNVDQLLYFLKYFSYPDHIVDFVGSHKGKLDHLLYAVAFDCSLGSKGLEFGKSSYYGVF